MTEEPTHAYAFEALGTHWKISVWDEISSSRFEELADECVAAAREFDALYSRFIADSMVVQLSKQAGEFEVPADLVSMLRLYEALYGATEGKINPCIGFAMGDSGYDAQYSLTEAPVIRDVPPFPDTIDIIDGTHIRLRQRVLLDLGALGKGYLVDMLYAHLEAVGVLHFLVDGSGDIRYRAGEGSAIVCGLEHPLDPTLAIGTLALRGGALCASATNRRRWSARHHYIDPHTKESPREVIATWVWAPTAALADGLSSALFFVEPEALAAFTFEYLVVRHDMHAKSSAGFTAELFG